MLLGAKLFPEGFGEESELKGASKQLCHIPHIQSPHEIKPMNLHRPYADLQHIRDFSIRMPG
jgi:hypothetical protein